MICLVWHFICHTFWHIFWHSIWHLFWHTFWHILTFFLAYILTLFLAFYLVYLRRFFVVEVRGEHSDPELVVEVRRGHGLAVEVWQGPLWPLRSSACSWDHSDPGLAVRVRRGLLRSRACSWHNLTTRTWEVARKWERALIAVLDSPCQLLQTILR